VTPATETCTLSLHDALPIYRDRYGALVGNRVPPQRRPAPDDWCRCRSPRHPREVGPCVSASSASAGPPPVPVGGSCAPAAAGGPDRKSTRLNSSHAKSSYPV